MVVWVKKPIIIIATKNLIYRLLILHVETKRRQNKIVLALQRIKVRMKKTKKKYNKKDPVWTRKILSDQEACNRNLCVKIIKKEVLFTWLL